MRRKYSIILVVLSVSALFGAYLWGYSCGKQEQDKVAKAELFDRLIGDLANSILVDDAIEVGREGEVRPVVRARIESAFADVVHLYREYGFESAAHLRCAVSRRFRTYKEEGSILVDASSRSEYPIGSVSSYLKTECLGEPSRRNWMQ